MIFADLCRKVLICQRERGPPHTYVDERARARSAGDGSGLPKEKEEGEAVRQAAQGRRESLHGRHGGHQPLPRF